MKVLHFFKTYYPDTMGGVEQLIFQLAEGGRCHGIESEVLSLSSRGRTQGVVLGQHVIHTAPLDLHVASTSFSLGVFKDFRELAREADIIHFHFPWPFMDVVHLVVGFNKPYVVTYHSDIVKQRLLKHLYKPLMYHFLKGASAIVATSPNYLHSSKVLGRFRKKVKIVPIGLDPSTYPSPQTSVATRWRYELGPRFFLFVGALRYYKGINYLLAAAAQCRYPLVIVGTGPLEQSLKEQAQKLDLKHVHFLGALSDADKVELLNLCEALVFPSCFRSEAFGISLLEASMYGKPMISCEIGTGTTFVNLDQITGLVIPPASPQAIADAMTYLWENPATAAQMGENARIRFAQLFTAEQMLREYASIYRDCLR